MTTPEYMDAVSPGVLDHMLPMPTAIDWTRPADVQTVGWFGELVGWLVRQGSRGIAFVAAPPPSADANEMRQWIVMELLASARANEPVDEFVSLVAQVMDLSTSDRVDHPQEILNRVTDTA